LDEDLEIDDNIIRKGIEESNNLLENFYKQVENMNMKKYL